MRISDWSSDVCSSDLLRQLGNRERQQVSGAGDRDDAVGVDRGNLRRLQHACAAVPAQRKQRLARLLPPGQVLEAGDEAVAVRGREHEARVVVTRGQRLERRAGGRRSEEHTSELQSLMRISYAVFCLKQKR